MSVLRSPFPLEVEMSPFEPWLKQPEPEEKSLYNQEESKLLMNILRSDPDEKPPVDWFLDQLTPEESDEG